VTQKNRGRHRKWAYRADGRSHHRRLPGYGEKDEMVLPPKRKCEICGCKLNQYNQTDRCALCRKKGTPAGSELLKPKIPFTCNACRAVGRTPHGGETCKLGFYTEREHIMVNGKWVGGFTLIPKTRCPKPTTYDQWVKCLEAKDRLRRLGKMLAGGIS